MVKTCSSLPVPQSFFEIFPCLAMPAARSSKKFLLALLSEDF
jgi:hypothetical protein